MCSICKPYVEYKVFMCKCIYMQKQPPEMFFKKSVLRNFAKLTAKKPVRNCNLRFILAWSLFCLMRVYLGLHFLQFLFEN